VVHHCCGVSSGQKRKKLGAQSGGGFKQALCIKVERERAVKRTWNMACDWVERLYLAPKARGASGVDQGLRRPA
jgi:hypothetical protein